MSEWVKTQIDVMLQSQLDYKDRSVLVSLKRYVEQLDKRIEQYEHEIDSKMWQPSKW